MNLRNILPSDRRAVSNGQNGHRQFDTGMPPVLALTAETPSSHVSELLEARYAPRVDVYQNRDFYVVRMDIAGMKESDLKVGIESGFLTVSGRRQPADGIGIQNLVRSEIIFSEFEQMVHLTDDVFVEGIDATYRYGVLEIKIPRRHASGTRKISINNEPSQAAAGGGRP
ncbi:MAG: Hsp20/alpha crystallin family protein [bacterium]